MVTGLNTTKISQLLTQSTQNIDETTLSALAKVRRNALSHQKVQSPVFALAASRWTYSLIPHSAHQWVATGLLAVMLVIGAGYWQHSNEQQINELDVAILTDEMPIELLLTDSIRS